MSAGKGYCHSTEAAEAAHPAHPVSEETDDDSDALPDASLLLFFSMAVSMDGATEPD